MENKIPYYVEAWGIQRPRYLWPEEKLRQWAADSEEEAKEYCGPGGKPIEVVVMLKKDFEKLIEKLCK